MPIDSSLQQPETGFAQRTLADILQGPGHPAAFHSCMTPTRPGAVLPGFIETRRTLLEQHDKAPKDIPPLVIISLPKSGSSLVNGTLKSALGLVATGFSWGYYDVVPGWARWVAQGGVVTHDHLWPSALTLEKLFDNGIGRIFIHYRDPRAAAVSRAHHYKRCNDSFIFESHVAHNVPWILGWLELAEQHPDRIALSCYERLMAGPAAYFQSVLDWFAVDARYHEAVRLRVAVELTDTQGNNFRQGTVDGWRGEVSPELRARLWAYTPEPLKKKLEMIE